MRDVSRPAANAEHQARRAAPGTASRTPSLITWRDHVGGPRAERDTDAEFPRALPHGEVGDAESPTVASSSASDPQITRNPAAVRRGHICSSSFSFIVATDASGIAGAMACDGVADRATAAASGPRRREPAREAFEICRAIGL